MLASNIPPKFNHPWAYSAGGAYIRAVPEASQIGIQNGAASLTDGFPPNCFVPIAGGGSWPWGQDANGILNQITAWDRWLSAGGRVAWDSAFSAAIGGYPQGAIVSSATILGLQWLCTVDNNVTNPDTGGAGWIRSQPRGIQQFSASGNFTVPTGVHRLFGQGWGGGGGAGGSNPGCTTGGGAGGSYGAGWFDVTPGAVIPITVGAGGLAGGTGGAGGTTSIGALLSVPGGLGSLPNTVVGGFNDGGLTGGAAIGGQVSIPGPKGANNGNIGGQSVSGSGGGAPFMGTGGYSNLPGINPGAGAGGSSGSVGTAGGAGLSLINW